MSSSHVVLGWIAVGRFVEKKYVFFYLVVKWNCKLVAEIDRNRTSWSTTGLGLNVYSADFSFKSQEFVNGLLNFFFLNQTLHIYNLIQGRVGSTRVGPGRVRWYTLTLDPMRAGPDRPKSGLTLALLGSGQVGPALGQCKSPSNFLVI